MPKFIESDVCKSRQNCIPCRRDAAFRDNFEKQMGEKWECPLGIPIDATDEQYPADIIGRYREMVKQMEERNKKVQEAQAALEELALVLTGENLVRLEKIRSIFFPHTKTASKCANSTKQIGEVDQVCCGGTIRKVAAFDCSKHTVCTDKKCMGCSDFTARQ